MVREKRVNLKSKTRSRSPHARSAARSKYVLCTVIVNSKQKRIDSGTPLQWPPLERSQSHLQSGGLYRDVHLVRKMVMQTDSTSL